MGDADNTLPPSKKRSAGRELSRDNPGLDDEEEFPEQETSTFKKASDEVLANRRIVKVRRSQPSSSPAPSSNPFAAIRLVPPTDSTATQNSNTQEIGKTVSEEAELPSSVNKTTEKVDGDVVNKVDGPEAAQNADSENDESKKETEIKEVGNDENKDENAEKSTATGSVSSFQQLSSTQNAFTGLTGSGFPSTTFSFGSIPKTDQPTFPSFSFDTNGNSSIFSKPTGASLGDNPEGIKIPQMQEVHVETGEENEKAVFTADSVLFEFLDGGWKERGKGELKVNVPITGTKKARLVMRARGNYRLILNASIFPDMKLTNMDKKGITFACLNSTGDGKDGLSTFALKFRDASFVEVFRSVVAEHRGKTADGVVVKTPENSPKASDE